MNLTPAQIIKKKGLDQAKGYLNEQISGGFLLTDADIELQRLIQSHDLVEHHKGLDECIDLLSSVESKESEYGGRLGVEYKKSSSEEQDFALMLCDEGTWCASKHFNHELDNASKFLNIKRLIAAVKDVQLCQAAEA